MLLYRYLTYLVLTTILMEPSTFCISPSMAAISEDFPAPTCPTTATRLPRGMLTLTLKQQKLYRSKEMKPPTIRMTIHKKFFLNLVNDKPKLAREACRTVFYSSLFLEHSSSDGLTLIMWISRLVRLVRNTGKTAFLYWQPLTTTIVSQYYSWWVHKQVRLV